MYSPIVPANLQLFHQKFVNELASHGIDFLEIGPKNPQLMNEQGSLLSKQLVDGNGSEWRYFEDSSTFYWDGVTWIEGIPEPEKKKKNRSKKCIRSKETEGKFNQRVCPYRSNHWWNIDGARDDFQCCKQFTIG